MLFTIPIEKEILAFQKHQNNPLGKQLIIFCDSIGVEYIDLLPTTSKLDAEQIKSLFLSCDGHWSEQGNAFAKQLIEQQFSFYQR